jgi:hypothetical protein
MTEIRTYKISAEYMGYLNEKVAKLNKRIERKHLDTAPIKLVDLGTEYETMNDGKTVRKFHRIRVNGDAPRYMGWLFVAILQYVPDAGMFVRIVPGMTIPEKYRNASSECEHCGYNRRRNETYIVFHEKTSTYKQVGSTCLKDFLGGNDPHAVAAYAEMLADMEDELTQAEEMSREHGEGGPRLFLLREYLAFVAQVIEDLGWLPRSKANEETGPATADRAMFRMFPLAGAKFDPPADRHYKLADDALEWAQTLHERENLNDYLHNLKVITSTRAISYKMVGVAASLIPVYERETAPRESFHVEGKEGDLIEVEEAKCIFTKATPGYTGGTAWLCKFAADVDGKRFILSCFINKPKISFDKGDVVNIQAKIKKFTEFNGVKQTELNYAKVWKAGA